MKILFIASDNNATSGAFLSMVKLNELLNKKYNVQTKIILPKRGDGEELLIQAGIEYEYIYSRSWIVKQEKNLNSLLRIIAKWLLQYSNLIAIKKIQKVIQKDKIDIVHINTTFSYVGAYAALRENTKLIWHLREFLEEDRNIKILNRKKGYKLINSSDKIIAISKSIYQKYEKIFDKEKLVTVYNGIPVEKFYTKRMILERDVIHFVIVGSISPEKGQVDLIKACALLFQKGVQFKLDIIGKADVVYKEQLTKIIEKYGMGKNIIFRGMQKDVLSYLKQADIAFVCSKNEAFGRVTIEAMLAGCIVIGANTAGTVELLENGEYGIIYQQGNENDLAQKILMVNAQRDEMKCLAQRAQKYAKEVFSAENNAKEIYQMYRKLICE